MRRELECVLQLAREIDAAELPRLAGDLAEIHTTILARLAAPPAATPDTNLEVPEVAHRLGVSVNFVYRNHEKKYKAFRRREGGRLLFSARGLDEYLKKSR
jgi:hypothetical protein